MAFTATFLNLCNSERLPFTLLSPFTQRCHLPFTENCANFQLCTLRLLGSFFPCTSYTAVLVLLFTWPCTYELQDITSIISGFSWEKKT